MTHPHTVTVNTRLDDEGTEDEVRVVDSVVFTCTAPADGDCRTCPDCDCESWQWDTMTGAIGPDGIEMPTHDIHGHERIPGRECWLIGWFQNNAAIYNGADRSDTRDDGIPAVDRSGPIRVWFIEEWPEWRWLHSSNTSPNGAES